MTREVARASSAREGTVSVEELVADWAGEEFVELFVVEAFFEELCEVSCEAGEFIEAEELVVVEELTVAEEATLRFVNSRALAVGAERLMKPKLRKAERPKRPKMLKERIKANGLRALAPKKCRETLEDNLCITNPFLFGG